MGKHLFEKMYKIIIRTASFLFLPDLRMMGALLQAGAAKDTELSLEGCSVSSVP